MKLLTVSNLFPRPDRPQAGMFNLQLFAEMAGVVRDQGGELRNVCLVPEWHVWRWPAIRRWTTDGRQPTVDNRRQHQEPRTKNQEPRTSFPPITCYVPVVYVPGIGRNLSAWTYRHTMRPVADAVAWADVVYAAWLYPDGVAASRLARQAGKPCWLMVQGTDIFHLNSAPRRKMILDACASAAGVVCVAAHLADRLRQAGVAEAKLHVIPNGVDPRLFCFRGEREALRGLDPEDQRLTRMVGRPLLLFVGNLVAVKNPGLLLETFAVWRARTNSGHLVMIGEGPLRDRLTRQAEALGIAMHVSLLGRRPHAQVARWMNVADGLCMTSRSEGMPNVILEALASGLPVVATDAGACRELLAGVGGCRIAGAHTPNAMSAALGEVLGGTIDRRQMATRCEIGGWDRMARRILGLIGGDGEEYA